MRWPSALALATCLLLAGCFGGGEKGTAGAPGDGDVPGGDDGDPLTAGNGTGGASAAAPPTWAVGQSWTWHLSGVMLPSPVEATTVVLAADAASYDVGITDVAGGVNALPFHVVALGAVAADCLCWDAHGSSVRLLRFPLVDGDRFTNDFWSAPGAEVTVTAAQVEGPDGPEPGFRSVATYSGGGTFLAADYSTQRGQFVRVATHFGGETPFAEAVLVSEGSGATGIGFRATERARYNANAGDPTTLAPRQLSVPAGNEVLLLACFLPDDEGAYGAEVTTAGMPLHCASSPTATGFAWAYAAAAEGPGAVQAFAAGESGVNVEVFAVDTSPPA